MIAQAVEAELAGFLDEHNERTDELKRRQIVRNGYLSELAIQTGIGAFPVKVPKVRDRSRSGIQFRSELLPPYLRRTRSMEELLPWLYLKGVSTGDFQEALTASLGPQEAGLSPATIGRLKSQWQEEHAQWEQRSLAGKLYVYLWADGVYFSVRGEEAKQYMLVIAGVTEHGHKERVAIEDGGWKTVIPKERSGGLTYALNANSDAGKPNTTVSIGSYDRQLTAGNQLATNAWTHLAATYDGARQRLNVNGSQEGSRAQSGNFAVSTNPLRIGGSTVWGGQFFQGRMDDVRIYNRAVSQTEITALAQHPASTASATTQPATSPTSPCATPGSLWNNATTPALAADPDTAPIELGMKFRSSVAGQVTGMRFYKSAQNTGTRVGRLWSGSGQLLAQATFTNQSASGWQQASFASPVAIKANTTYVVPYHTRVGGYALDQGYFNAPYTKGPLQALSTGEAGGKGVYRSGSGGVFPTATYRASNYWVDVVFKTP